ncbi:MAG: cobalamin-dependent protein [Thermodesulfobacteriota bacterium]
MHEQKIMGQISDSIIKGRAETFFGQPVSRKTGQAGVPELIRLSIQKKMPPPMVAKEAFDKAMDESVKKFEKGEYNVPELISRSKYTALSRGLLAKHTQSSDVLNKGKIILATVEGEHHRHGIDIVACLSRGFGLHTIDLGFSVPVDEIVRSVKYHEPEYLGISASILATIPTIKRLSSNLSKAGCRGDIKMIVGGYVAQAASPGAIGVDEGCHNMTKTIRLFKDITA